jgi:hypothetical protein
MKQKFVNALNIASGIFNEVALEGDEKNLTYRLCEYGEFPATDVDGNPIIQVVDAEAGRLMAENFQTLGSKIATLFRGVPIYEGHADDSDWAARNPGHKASAVGRIKSFANRVDGIYVTSVLNSDGHGLLGGEAPRYTGHSPLWRLVEIPGRPGYFRPVLLWSDALTNKPQILGNTIALNSLQGMPELSPDDDLKTDPIDPETTTETETEINMKLTLAALLALGFTEGADPSPEDISAAILTLAGKETKPAPAETQDTKMTDAANTAVVNRAIDIVLEDAIKTGRITAADKPRWATALNTSFESEHAKLQSLMPVINTGNKVVNLAARGQSVVDVANTAEALTEGAKRYAVENHIDISTPAGWNRAYEGFKAANPALFAKG